MRVGIIGINHKSADVRLREKLAQVTQRLFGPANSAHPLFSYVLLSTCNRTEIYFCSEDLAQTHTYLLNVLRREIQEEFEHRIYSYFGRDCFFHLARVTAGVDSALVGETEIQGQVKRAYEMAATYTTLQRDLHFLFQKCLKLGKNIRSTFRLNRGLPSLEEAIINAGTELLGCIKQRKILFVGVSEINHKIFKNFKNRGFNQFVFCNRTNEKALNISKKEGVDYLNWERLHRWIEFDIAIFGTKSPYFLVNTAQNAQRCRLVIDLSVPRNVDPRIGRHSKVTLLNVDQLNRAIDKKRKLKAEEIARIETQHIAGAVDKQVNIFKLKELQRLSGTLMHAL